MKRKLMKKKRVLVSGIIAIIVIALIFYFIIFHNNFGKIKKVCFEDKCVNAEIALDSESWERGLMGRENLCFDCGMLFIFDNSGKHGFWMKNTLIPLDIIWINSDMRITAIVEALPCLAEECIAYVPDEDSLYVLEVNKGFSRENDLKKGDLVEIGGLLASR